MAKNNFLLILLALLWTASVEAMNGSRGEKNFPRGFDIVEMQSRIELLTNSYIEDYKRIAIANEEDITRMIPIWRNIARKIVENEMYTEYYLYGSKLNEDEF